MPAGRPTKYKPEYCQQAFRHCLLGATNPELARLFDVSATTIDKWIAEIPEFSGAVKDGREEADSYVAASLYGQAMEGNTTAQIFWLKNRRQLNWRDTQHQKTEGSVTVNVQRFTDPNADDKPTG